MGKGIDVAAGGRPQFFQAGDGAFDDAGFRFEAEGLFRVLVGKKDCSRQEGSGFPNGTLGKSFKCVIAPAALDVRHLVQRFDLEGGHLFEFFAQRGIRRKVPRRPAQGGEAVGVVSRYCSALSRDALTAGSSFRGLVRRPITHKEVEAVLNDLGPSG